MIPYEQAIKDAIEFALRDFKPTYEDGHEYDVIFAQTQVVFTAITPFIPGLESTEGASE